MADWTTISVAAITTAGTLGGGFLGYFVARLNVDAETERQVQQQAAEKQREQRAFRERELERRRDTYTRMVQLAQDQHEAMSGLTPLTVEGFEAASHALATNVSALFLIASDDVRVAAQRLMGELNTMWKAAVEADSEKSFEARLHVSYLEREEAINDARYSLTGEMRSEIAALSAELGGEGSLGEPDA